jgi:hypothetical protein
MFSGLPSVYKGWNSVRVPPRARITPRQRGFCFNVWTLTLGGSSELSAVCAWRRGGQNQLCGWRGQGPACRPSACWNLGLWVVLSRCFRWPVGGRHSFMAKSCGDDMTKLNFLRGSSADSCLRRNCLRALIACLSGQRGCARCAHFCARAAFGSSFWSRSPGSAFTAS